MENKRKHKTNNNQVLSFVMHSIRVSLEKVLQCKLSAQRQESLVK
jgi:hypothetical protein